MKKMKEMTLDDTLCAASGTDGGRHPLTVPNTQNLPFKPCSTFFTSFRK